MKAHFKSTLLALAIVLPASGAWTVANEMLVLQPQSRLWIDGTSSIRSFSCKAGEVNAAVEAVGPNAIAQLLSGEKGVKTVRVTVPADLLDCGNGTMNEHMRKAIKLSEHKSIEFRLSDYEVAKSTESVSGTINGSLLLGGVTKPITLKAEGEAQGAMLHVTGSYELDMTEYGLKPPTLMFGRIKVGKTVKVNYDLLLKS